MGSCIAPEIKIALMVWLCTKEDSGSNGACQMCIVTGPNIDFATNLIRTLKNIFKRKLEPTITDEETVLHLNPIRV